MGKEEEEEEEEQVREQDRGGGGRGGRWREMHAGGEGPSLLGRRGTDHQASAALAATDVDDVVAATEDARGNRAAPAAAVGGAGERRDDEADAAGAGPLPLLPGLMADDGVSVDCSGGR